MPKKSFPNLINYGKIQMEKFIIMRRTEASMDGEKMTMKNACVESIDPRGARVTPLGKNDCGEGRKAPDKRNQRRARLIALALCAALTLLLWTAAAGAAERITDLDTLREKMLAGGDFILGNTLEPSFSLKPLVVPVGKTVTLDLNGYSINLGRTAEDAAGNVISVQGALTVKDSRSNGKITGGYNGGSGGTPGGGVYVGGTFTLESGEISGNKSRYGGGVYVAAGGTFTMKGGAITGNTATTLGGSGGGVQVDSTGTFMRVSRTP